MSRRSLLAAAALLLLGACSDELTPPTRVTKLRVLGARVEVQGEPTRSWPAPGETATVRWRVVFPAESRPLSWAFTSCVAESIRVGQPACQGAPLALSVQSETTLAEPSFTFTLPDAATLGDSRTLLVLGSVCAGRINLDPEARRACADPAAEGQIVVLTLPIADDPAAGNRHPEIGEITLEGAPLLVEPAADAEEQGCASDAAIPQRSRGGAALELSVEALAGSREPFEALRGVPPMPVEQVEELQITVLGTAGRLERLFSFIDDDTPRVEIDWTPPDEEERAIDASGLLVRFYVVMRDGRGGIDWQERALCLIP